jgi:hypothetical protein
MKLLFLTQRICAQSMLPLTLKTVALPIFSQALLALLYSVALQWMMSQRSLLKVAG